MLVHRAEEAGFKAICLTVDTPSPSPKERDLRNQYERRHDLGNFRGSDRPRSEISGTDETPGWNVSSTTPLTWRELEWLRGLTSLPLRSEEHTSELQSRTNLVCRLLLEKKNKNK